MPTRQIGGMARKILCVAEKPSIAKTVAQHLSGGQVNTRSITGSQFVKNYEFNYNFGQPWGQCDVTMTSVLGHLTQAEFPDAYRKWHSCDPIQLFDAPLMEFVTPDKEPIAKNITQQARYCRALFIWTDCDREGEHIGAEVRNAALQGNPNLEVKRARFNNSERSHVIRAAQSPTVLDERQVKAVAARIELDLRLGASFTRFTTLNLKPLGAPLSEREQPISYGSCQFPTLGFVVDRYFRVKNFVPEPFWGIKVMQKKDDTEVNFLWKRHRLFDRAAVVVLFERCLNARLAKVSKLQKKPTSKWRPLPLTTVELQRLGSMYLRMDSQRVMQTAEKLYNGGWISYPRTETDQFDRAFDLRRLIEKQTQDQGWGSHAQGLLNGNFKQPRPGRNDDQAHPPIHPVNYVASRALPDDDHRRVYEFIVRRFLACCSEDAKGESSIIEIQYGEEEFSTTGLTVLERNYLDVYPYEKWTSSQPLPKFDLNETFEPTEAHITEGKTTAPGYLTEPELIGLMDANGIGTDATMAEHIAKIKERQYVVTQARSGSTSGSNNDNDDVPNRRGSTSGRGRGRGRGRGGNNTAGRSNNTVSSSVEQFIPTTLGVALIEGYDSIGLDTSLGKPFLRKEMEVKMKEVCVGTKTKEDFVRETLAQYREVFVRSQRQVGMLKAACRKYVFGMQPSSS